MNEIEIAQLHQIGEAAAKYLADTGQHPYALDDLVQAGLIPVEVCYSPLDPFPAGIANEQVKEFQSQTHHYRGNGTDYPRTYLGPSDFGWPEEHVRQEIHDRPGAGWLVCCTCDRWTPDVKILTQISKRPYLRLLMDGTVEPCVSRIKVMENGDKVWEMLSLYRDDDTL